MADSLSYAKNILAHTTGAEPRDITDAQVEEFKGDMLQISSEHRLRSENLVRFAH